MTYKDHAIKSVHAFLVIVLLTATPLSLADVTSELFLFPQLDAGHNAQLDDSSPTERNDEVAGVDFFLTLGVDNFRFLGEFLLSSEEQHFERFQLGWSYKNHLFWLGRYHNPIGYWNSAYHHGAHLQTSISRPAIVEFEHEGGVLPIHFAGLLAEGTFGIAEQEFGYSLALASGPEFDHKLMPWKVSNPGSVPGDTSGTLNLYHTSSAGNEGRTGVFFNYTQIPAEAVGVDEIRHISAGLYGSREFSRWRWHGSSFYVHNRLESLGGTQSSSAFFNAFLQAEYSPGERWTFYGRIEQTLGAHEDAYLALFPEFVEDRILGGVRYDFASIHALKLELSTNHVREDNFTRVMLQWSAMF